MIINGEEFDLFNLKKEQVAIHKMARGLQGVIRFNGYSDWSVAEHSFILAKIVETMSTKLLKTYIKNLVDMQRLKGREEECEKEWVKENKHFYEIKERENQYIISLFSIEKNLDKNMRNENENFYFLQEELMSDFKSQDCDLIFNKNAKGAYQTKIQKIINEVVLEALIHDFSEALTGDVIKPFKTLIPAISELEDQIDAQIRGFYRVKTNITPLVHFLDKQIAVIEMIYLTRFYGKTLINETDERQVIIISKPFFNHFKDDGVLSYLTCLIFGEDLSKLSIGKTLSDKNLFDFLNLNQSEFSFKKVWKMEKEDFLQEFVKYAVSVS